MLTDRGISPRIICVLIISEPYDSFLHGMVYFQITFLAVNGVKQGGVMSPIIFSVYIDGLLVRLIKARVGCHIGSYYVVVLAYADDIVLLAPSLAAICRTLQTCDEYANEHSIVSNGRKSKCLISEPRKLSQFVRTLHRDMRQFVICGKEIEFVYSFVHLGHVIRSDMDDNDDIENQRCNFIGQTNNVWCYFGKLVSDVKYSLFKSYCRSIMVVNCGM